MKHEHIRQFEVDTDAVRVLRLARHMIEHDGWCQSLAFAIYNDGTHHRCTSQAILDAAFETAHRDRCAALIEEANGLFIAALGPLNNNLPDWNDYKRRTKADVLAAFDRAIKIGLSRG